jgi:ABC-type Fe3+ transport system substrate-binding protein
MEDRIMTKHPQKKSGVNIQRDKYEQVCAAIESALKENGPQTFQALNEVVDQKLEGKFDGSIGWYYTTVKLDLEARGVLVCERKSGQPQMIRWVGN